MPAVVGAEVGESDDLAAEEDFYAVVELAESAGGEPEEFRKDWVVFHRVCPEPVPR